MTENHTHGSHAASAQCVLKTTYNSPCTVHTVPIRAAITVHKLIGLEVASPLRPHHLSGVPSCIGTLGHMTLRHISKAARLRNCCSQLSEQRKQP